MVFITSNKLAYNLFLFPIFLLFQSFQWNLQVYKYLNCDNEPRTLFPGFTPHSRLAGFIDRTFRPCGVFDTHWLMLLAFALGISLSYLYLYSRSLSLTL